MVKKKYVTKHLLYFLFQLEVICDNNIKSQGLVNILIYKRGLVIKRF